MHKCIVFTVEEEISEKIHFLDIQIAKSSNNTFSTLCIEKKILFYTYFPGIRFAPQKLKIVQCIINRAVKICTDDCFGLKLDNISKFFFN